MPVFEYTARNLKGALEKGQVDLPGRDDVIAHLRKNRLVVVNVRQAHSCRPAALRRSSAGTRSDPTRPAGTPP